MGRRRACGQGDGERGRDRAGSCEAGQRGLQAAVEDRRVDAAGKAAQLNERFGGVAVRRADEPADAGVLAGVPEPDAVQAFPDLAEDHHERGEPDLRPVMQVRLDLAQGGSRIINGTRPGPLQFADTIRQSASAEHGAGQEPVGDGYRPKPPAARPAARSSRWPAAPACPARCGRSAGRRCPGRAAQTGGNPADPGGRGPAGSCRRSALRILCTLFSANVGGHRIGLT